MSANAEYIVVQHSSGPAGGLVVRPTYRQSDDTYWTPNPYTGAEILAGPFKRESTAKRHAAKMMDERDSS